MSRLLKFLITGVGIPLVAEKLQHQTQKFSIKLMMMTLIAKHRKKIIYISTIGIIGLIFGGCGLSLTVFAIAQQYDLNAGPFALNASMIVALSISVIGVVCIGYGWSAGKKLEHAIAHEIIRAQQPTSNVRTILNTVIHAWDLIPEDESKGDSYSRRVSHDHDLNDHRKTLN